MKLKNIPKDQIKVGERFREHPNEGILELIDSIKDKGLIQPITVDEDLNLIAGERRLKACLAIGSIKDIPCVIRKVEGELDAREVELFENLHRKQMTWAEECKLIKRIQELWKERYPNEPWKWSQGAIADGTEKSRPAIHRKMQIADFMDVIPELADCKTEEEAAKKIKRIQKDLLVKQLREQQEEEIKSGKSETIKHAASHFRIGDAFEGMEEIIAGYEEDGTTSVISLIEVDPPYSIKLEEVKKRREDNPDDSLGRYNEIDPKDYPDFLHRIAKLTYEIASPNCWLIFWYGSSWHTDVKIALANAGWILDPIPGIWYKGHGQTNYPSLYLARTYEPFFIARKGKVAIRKEGRGNVFQYTPVGAAAKYHPTQRPLELMVDILETFCYPNEKILVPFLGSGVTLRAAYKTNLLGYGWDLDNTNKDNFLVHVQEDEWHVEQEQKRIEENKDNYIEEMSNEDDRTD